MKKILSFICSACVAVSAISLPFFICEAETVSALSSSSSQSEFPSVFFDPSVSQSSYQECIDALQQNESISNLGDCYILINRGSQVEIMIFQDFTNNLDLYDGYYGINVTVYVPDKFGMFTLPFSNLSTYDFTIDSVSLPSPSNVNQYSPRCLAVYQQVSFPYIPLVLDSNHDIRDRNPNYHCFYSSVTPPFVPEFETVPLPFYSMDVDSFEDWIINNNKLSELPSYIIQSKLKSFLEFYKQFGSSNAFFISKIPLWFAHMNIANQSISNISALKSAIDKLYQEYINYRSGTHAYWPGATKIQERDTIDTKTDNNDLTLVTDDSNDPLDISILRDILRGVIAISNNVNQGCANIVQKLDELNFVVNVVNDGGDSSPIDFSSLYTYDSDAFSDDLQTFEANVEEVQNIPQGYIDTINQNSLMPENMLSDKNSLTVNVPCITGFTISNNGSSYSTQTGTYTLRSSEYPWLDTVVQKIKRFASIILIIGYLVHLRYRIPELVRGE